MDLFKENLIVLLKVELFELHRVLKQKNQLDCYVKRGYSVVHRNREHEELEFSKQREVVSKWFDSEFDRIRLKYVDLISTDVFYIVVDKVINDLKVRREVKSLILKRIEDEI